MWNSLLSTSYGVIVHKLGHIKGGKNDIKRGFLLQNTSIQTDTEDKEEEENDDDKERSPLVDIEEKKSSGRKTYKSMVPYLERFDHSNKAKSTPQKKKAGILKGKMPFNRSGPIFSSNFPSSEDEAYDEEKEDGEASTAASAGKSQGQAKRNQVINIAFVTRAIDWSRDNVHCNQIIFQSFETALMNHSFILINSK